MREGLLFEGRQGRKGKRVRMRVCLCIEGTVKYQEAQIGGLWACHAVGVSYQVITRREESCEGGLSIPSAH